MQKIDINYVIAVLICVNDAKTHVIWALSTTIDIHVTFRLMPSDTQIIFAHFPINKKLPNKSMLILYPITTYNVSKKHTSCHSHCHQGSASNLGARTNLGSVSVRRSSVPWWDIVGWVWRCPQGSCSRAHTELLLQSQGQGTLDRETPCHGWHCSSLWDTTGLKQ